MGTNALSIPVNARAGDVIRKLENVADASRTLQAALDADFEGSTKAVMRTYLALQLNRDPKAKGGLKTYKQIAADLGDVVAIKTVQRFVAEIDPQLKADMVSAHPVR